MPVLYTMYNGKGFININSNLINIQIFKGIIITYIC